MRGYGIPDNKGVIADIYEGFECTVVDGSVTSDWFMIKSRLKQRFVMCGFLFLLCSEWVMRKAPTDKRRGIRWNFTSLLGDLDFADDIAPLPSPFNYWHERLGDWQRKQTE